MCTVLGESDFTQESIDLSAAEDLPPVGEILCEQATGGD